MLLAFFLLIENTVKFPPFRLEKEPPKDSIVNYNPFYTENFICTEDNPIRWIFNFFYKNLNLMQIYSEITMGFTDFGWSERIPESYLHSNKEKIDEIMSIISLKLGMNIFIGFARIDINFRQAIKNYIESNDLVEFRLKSLYDDLFFNLKSFVFYYHMSDGNYYLLKNRFDDNYYFNMQIAALCFNMETKELFAYDLLADDTDIVEEVENE